MWKDKAYMLEVNFELDDIIYFWNGIIVYFNDF
jgi:hypothetical protein